MKDKKKAAKAKNAFFLMSLFFHIIIIAGGMAALIKGSGPQPFIIPIVFMCIANAGVMASAKAEKETGVSEKEK